MTGSLQSSPRMLITAGPTQEPIDRVRYLSNRSSGRMGVSLVEAAIRCGFPTTLLLGPIPTNPLISTAARVLRFRTTAELQALIREEWPLHDVLIMAAAVADYQVVGGAIEGKLERRGGRMTLELESTPDLLAEATTNRRPDQLVIGFALGEAHTLLDAASRKLREKRVDAIVANPLETMDAEDVTARVLLADGRVLSPSGHLTKDEFADWLMKQLPVIAAFEKKAN